ncbi:hypothetical protein RHMOL_Rhmol03G0039400 [Rhododendron molle]|uniref:Uncharacterized protein n=1 Tax=Rhododendron molle TaxID=49168 RepID=A0ACC0PBS8_RHOML|nr:hypothetical protein RHMOL_Rhmol03G0039400 [Rhododendron molle]
MVRKIQMLPLALEFLQVVLRTNFVFFYFEGLYYHISKRAAGIRYLFIGKQVNQRPRYQILGVFLLIQLCIIAAEGLRRTNLSSVASSVHQTSLGTHQASAVSDSGTLPEKDLNVKSETLPLLAILSPLARDSPSISNPNELAASWPCPKGKMEFKDVMKRKEKVTDMNENMDTEETIHPNVKVVSLVTGKWKENRLMQQAESANVCFALAIANTQQPHLVVMFFAELATANRNTGGGWVQIY